MMKKQWQKPELLVLTRSKPEEGVLTTCKQYETYGPWGPTLYCFFPGSGDCSSTIGS